MIFNKNQSIKQDQQALLLKLSAQVDGLIFQFQYFPDSNLLTFPYASKGIWDIFEVTPEMVKHDATKALDRIHKDDLKEVYKTMKHSMRTLESWNNDCRVILPSKGVRWLRGNGNPEMLRDGSFIWNGYITDITDRKRMEIELFESKQRMQFAIESSQNGIWDWDLQTNRVYYSKESKNLMGYEPNEINESPIEWKKRVHEDDLGKLLKAIKRHNEGKTEYYKCEYRIRCKDGSYKWILDKGKIVEKDYFGKALRVIGIHSDISDQKQKEEESRQTIDVVGEQNKRLLNFAHIVSHNLRSHSGNVEMLLEMMDQTKDPEEANEIMWHLKNVSGALADTIVHLEEIVSVQTNSKIKLEKLNLRNYINKTLMVLQGESNKREATINNLVSGDTSIRYNPAYLESILLNLLSNALKYQHPQRNPEIVIESFYEDKKLVLKISDNGKGIDLEKYGSQLFQMYKTFHENRDAVGIGLFITKSQVESMGGKIVVESTVNVGTIFKIYLS